MNKDRRYRFDTTFENCDEVIDWCNEHFGSKHKKRWTFSKGTGREFLWDVSWPQHSPIIYITNIEDAMAFKLRWS